MFDMDAIAAKVKAARKAAGLVAADGVHCSTAAQKDYRDFRHAMKQRADWGRLPAEMERKLHSLKAAADGAGARQ